MIMLRRFHLVSLLALAVLALGACNGTEPAIEDVQDAADEAAEGAEDVVEEATEAAEDAVDDTAAEASVSFAAPEDGATVSAPVALEFAANNFTIEPAGEVSEGAGHFHVMIDVGCVAPGEVIPSDDAHVHFGDGSTSAELELEPGTYSLCLQVGDGEHVALDLTDEITITVE